MKSKDSLTHIGAVIVGPHNELRSIGYNGMARGLNDEVNSPRQRRPEKYYWMVHGEMNAVLNSTLSGASVSGCVMYTNGVPCADCAKAIIQVGIRKVIVHKPWNDNNSEKWVESTMRSLEMFREAEISIEYYDEEIMCNIHGWRDGKEIKLEI